MGKNAYIDMVVRYVPGVGFLPIMRDEDRETYRGEYKQDPHEALASCINRAGKDGIAISATE